MATERDPSSGTDLLLVLRETKDTTALDGLLIKYLPLAYRIAEKFRDAGCCLTEVTEAATSGLHKALLENKSTSSQEMMALAVPAVVKAIKERMREQTSGGKWLQKLQSQTAVVERAVAKLTVDLGRPPMVAELAGFTGLSKDQVYETFELAEVGQPAADHVAGAADLDGVNLSLPNSQDHEERYLTPPAGKLDRSAIIPDRRTRNKAELLI